MDFALPTAVSYIMNCSVPVLFLVLCVRFFPQAGTHGPVSQSGWNSVLVWEFFFCVKGSASAWLSPPVCLPLWFTLWLWESFGLSLAWRDRFHHVIEGDRFPMYQMTQVPTSTSCPPWHTPKYAHTLTQSPVCLLILRCGPVSVHTAAGRLRLQLSDSK